MIQLLITVLVFVAVATSNEWVTHGGLREDLHGLEVRLTAGDRRGGICSKFSCLPGECVEFPDQKICLCPEGFQSLDDRCIEIPCASEYACWPGVCLVREQGETCLCPAGFTASADGACLKLNFLCNEIDCRPGKCFVEDGREMCLCPSGYTAGNKKCMVLSATNVGKTSTILLMIVVAVSSIMLTTFFGFCVCFYFRRTP
ncbi:latent-transforming growth factor beta-binding protein 2-like isoform X2 [Uloborus diversus]|uniref:latent-transforming growth factor beta-binding protein 2-like isoform X2 n=1 Tax=Uloborus diversus TaxID=327109 RepID=UPI0024091B6D|nr:latent-transforming growth factor beta-binding protein 2-like isoform X2 [Uloborus diversus]